jgi:myo-inositol-1-phosphate synthase
MILVSIEMISEYVRLLTFSSVLDGWDISAMNIGDAMVRAEVLDVQVQDQMYKQLSLIKPRPSIYDNDFIAANQVAITSSTKI